MAKYVVYKCPNDGCKRSEKAARPPHYAECPGCHRAAGDYVKAGG